MISLQHVRTFFKLVEVWTFFLRYIILPFDGAMHHRQTGHFGYQSFLHALRRALGSNRADKLTEIEKHLHGWVD